VNWNRRFGLQPEPGIPDEVMTWANRYAMAVDVICRSMARSPRVSDLPSLTLEPPLVYEGRYYPHFHRASTIAARLGRLFELSRPGSSSSPGGLEREPSWSRSSTPQRHLRSTATWKDPPRGPRSATSSWTGQVVGRVGVTGITTGPPPHFRLFYEGAGHPGRSIGTVPAVRRAESTNWPYRVRFRLSCLPSWGGGVLVRSRGLSSWRHWATGVRQRAEYERAVRRELVA